MKLCVLYVKKVVFLSIVIIDMLKLNRDVSKLNLTNNCFHSWREIYAINNISAKMLKNR